MKLQNVFKLIIIFVSLFISLSFTKVTDAQENTYEAAKKSNIVFPVAELGNCIDLASCKIYCNNEVNRESCTAFAKKKGFYKEEKRPNSEIIQSATTELGCDSESSCKTVCEKEENIEKCTAFAKKYNLGGQRGNPGDRQILEKAKTILGCDSESSCRSICDNSANQEKCSEFAKQTGLGGGVRRVGPGGCNSEESCRKYCETNMDECRKFGGGENRGTPPPEASRRGPGGCNSEESCREYCTKNPSECGIKDMQQNREQFCKDNPERCRPSEAERQSDNSSVRPSGYPENRREDYKPAENNMQGEQYRQDRERPSENNIREQESRMNFEQQRRDSQPADSTRSVQGVSTKISFWERVVKFLLYN